MKIYEIIISIVTIILSVVITLVITSQNAKQADLSALGGGVSSSNLKGRGQSNEARLAKLTRILAVALFVAVLAGTIVTNLVK